MQPTTNQDDRNLRVPSRQQQSTPPPTSQQAALGLMRDQIDKIYDDPQPNEQIAAQVDAAAVSENPYEQTHSESDDVHAAIDNDAVQQHWQKYHTQWQQYYQMYYERYYQAEVRKRLTSGVPTAQQFSGAAPQAIATPKQDTLSEGQAVNELRSELLDKVKKSGSKIRTSRHFKPALVALSVALVFGFLQYNQLLFASVMAFTVPASTDSSSSYIDPSTDIAVSQDPVLKIPKINVEAPVVYGLTSIDETVVQSKLKNGVVHYPIAGANALPGEIGNTVILGHSANDVFDDGNYKFIFLHLDRLEKGDTFYLNYEGKRYTYSVTEKKIIDPSQVSELVINNGKPMATLVTCTPPGTALKRLLIIGEQIAPDPSTATTSTESTTDTTDQSTIGGGTKGFFERLFSGN
jgi:sortase A